LRPLKTIAALIATLVLATSSSQAHTSPSSTNGTGTLQLEFCTIINGDFDDDLAGWTGRIESTADTTTGLPAPSRHLDELDTHDYPTQPLRLAAGVPVTITVWARSASTGEPGNTVAIKVFDEFPPAGWMPDYAGYWWMPMDDTWHEYALNFVPGAVTHTLELAVDAWRELEIDTNLLWYDAVGIECGPRYTCYLPLMVRE